MNLLARVTRALAILALLGAVLLAFGAGAVYWYLEPKLPSAEALRDVRLQVPLRVYARDGEFIAEFGEQRRTPLRRDQLPERMVQAFLASEDERFYQHPGVDWQGLTRAVLHLVRTGEKGPGGSTITMQVARNFFLGREKTYIRKLNEILLALKIELEFTKDEILELYANKIFLGQRAYGVGAAAEVYYGRPVTKLTLAQFAMIAGLPKAPSRFNPLTDPEQGVARRAYVLRRMLELGYIGQAEHDEARDAPVTASHRGPVIAVEALYVAEMVRAFMESTYGDEAFTAGYKVYTTIDSRLQNAANAALRQTLMEYDARHGFRGAEGHVALGPDASPPKELLSGIPVVGQLQPAVITSVDGNTVTAYARNGGTVEVAFEDMDWARPYGNENRRGEAPESAASVLKPGDVIRVHLTEEGWSFAQLPNVEGALVSLDPGDGAIVALSGGFDFFRSKFNRVTQARRQPGSSFKPFIYSAALEYGYTPASIINDAPVVFEDSSLASAWRPENYSGKFFGPTLLRTALYKSRNLVSIRLLREVGIDFALEHIARFGFDVERLPRALSLALGTGEVTPLEVARGYSVLANGGYAVDPYLIDRVLDWNDATLMTADPLVVCRDCNEDEATPAAEPAPGTESSPDTPSDARLELPAAPVASRGPAEARPAPRVIDARNAWLMYSLMRDVIRRGTGRKALVLERADLAGKTGTTNDQYDAWFSGFNPEIVATVWVGFDEFRPLGRRETGARAALPMWIAYMKEALAGTGEAESVTPDGIVTVRIDPATGELASPSNAEAVFESFRKERAPTRVERASSSGGATGVEQLF